MQPTEFIDTNFMLVVIFTIGLILVTLAYLGALHYMLKGKLWYVPLIILIGLFGYTLLEMDKDFQQASMGTVYELLILVVLKTTVILHGIYYISVLLGKYIGLRRATVILKENEVFIVLMSIATIIIMNNIHTFRWNFERFALMSVINIFMIYILVNFVFYLGEIKYFFAYFVPVFLVFVYNHVSVQNYASEKMYTFYQMQVALVGSLILSSAYFAIKIRLHFMDDRETIRKIEAIKMDNINSKTKKEEIKEETKEETKEEIREEIKEEIREEIKEEAKKEKIIEENSL